jgi:hypothetical protein
VTAVGSPRATGRIVAGVILLGLGALFLLDNFGVLDARDFLRFWPAILLALGLTRLMAPGKPEERSAGVVLSVLGAVFLLRAFHVPWFRLRMLWPLLLLILGASLIWQAIRGRRGLLPGLSDVREYARLGAAAGLEATRGLSAEPGQGGGRVEGVHVHGGRRAHRALSAFRGGEVTAIMGGFQIDLRAASISGEKRDGRGLHGSSEASSSRCRRPWNVVVSGTPILGMVSNTTSPIRDESAVAKTLVVRGSAIMGGIEVKN